MSLPEAPAPQPAPSPQRRRPLAERQDSAARQRAAALASKVIAAQAHNEHVAAVAAAAAEARAREAALRDAAARARVRDAERRRAKRLRRCEERLRERRAGWEGRRGEGSKKGDRDRDAGRERKGRCMVDERVAAAERRRETYLKSRSRAAARCSGAAMKGEEVSVDENVAEPVEVDVGRSTCMGRSAVAPRCSTGVKSAAPAVASSSSQSVSQAKGAQSVRTRQSFTPPGAARRLASYWLLYTGRQSLASAGLLSPSTVTADFDSTTVAIQSARADAGAQQVLRAIGGNPRASRILLSAILFALHHHHVLDGTTESEASALYSARRFVLCIHVGTLPALAHSWREWRRAYEAWRRWDRERLSEGILKDAVESELLRDAVRRRQAGDDAEIAVWEAEIDSKQQQLRSAMARLAGPEGVERLDAELARVKRIPDERLAHEIMVDLEGFLSRLQKAPTENHVWELLRIQLSAEPPQTEELFARFKRIEEDLNEMISGVFPLEDRSSIVMDGAYAADFVTRAAGALRRCHAESADGELDEWVRMTQIALGSASSTVELVSAVVDALRELTRRVAATNEQVRVARVVALAPIVQQHGVVWERQRHDERVAAGEIAHGLPLTQAFCASGRTAVHALVENSRELSVAAHARIALRAALVAACSSGTLITAEQTPEILLLDVERLVQFQNDMQRATLLAALDNTARQFIASRQMQARAVDVALVRAALVEEPVRLEAIQDSMIASVASALRGQYEVSEADSEFLRGMVQQTVQPGNAIYRLVFSRVEQEVRSLLLSSEMRQPPPRATGLGACAPEISELARRMELLATHAYNVHGDLIVQLTDMREHSRSGEVLATMED